MRKTKPQSFSGTEGSKRMVAEIMETGAYISESELMRAAISFLHKKHFPYYKKIKEETEKGAAEIEKLKRLPVEEYITKVLGEADTTTRKGYVILKHKNNPARTVSIPIDMVKNYASRAQVWKDAGIGLET